MADLERALTSIGLVEIYDILRAEGFETWQQLLDVSENDLMQCGIRVGHRRRLQRAIQDHLHYGDLSGLAPPAGGIDSRHSQDASTAPSLRTGTSPLLEHSSVARDQPQVVPKRKYRRHPKPDDNAPEKPSSAYVMFSNRIRERLRDQDLSFTTIAKIVGEQWQKPDPEERAMCEKIAQQRKEAYYVELSDYKKTQHYADYQKYLEDFKVKHHDQNRKGSKKVRNVDDDSADDDIAVPGDMSPYASSSNTPSSRDGPFDMLGFRTPRQDNSARQNSRDNDTSWMKPIGRQSHSDEPHAADHVVKHVSHDYISVAPARVSGQASSSNSVMSATASFEPSVSTQSIPHLRTLPPLAPVTRFGSRPQHHLPILSEHQGGRYGSATAGETLAPLRGLLNHSPLAPIPPALPQHSHVRPHSNHASFSSIVLPPIDSSRGYSKDDWRKHSGERPN